MRRKHTIPNIIDTSAFETNTDARRPTRRQTKAENIQLRPYQKEPLQAAQKNHDHTLIVHPCGAGKTLIAQALAKHYLDKQYKVLIATPKRIILTNFENPPKIDGHHIPRPIIFEHSRIEELKKALHKPHPVDIYCACHDSTTEVLEEPQNTRLCLIIDEAHYLGGKTKLGQLIHQISRQHPTHLLTATDFRTDNYDICDRNKYHIIKRTIHQHHIEGYCPNINIHFRLRQDQEQLIDAIVRELKSQHKKGIKNKTIIYACTEETQTDYRTFAYELEKRLKAEIPNIRILNLGSTDGKKLVSETSQAKKQYRKLKNSNYDVVININVLKEGIDWPPCNQVFLPKVPNSMNTLIQCIGRTLRPKEKTSDIYFFEPIRDTPENKQELNWPLFKLLARLAAFILGEEFNQPFRGLEIDEKLRQKTQKDQQQTTQQKQQALTEAIMDIHQERSTNTQTIQQLQEELEITQYKATELTYSTLDDTKKEFKDKLEEFSRNKIINEKDFKEFIEQPEIQEIFNRLKPKKTLLETYGIITSNTTHEVKKILEQSSHLERLDQCEEFKRKHNRKPSHDIPEERSLAQYITRTITGIYKPPKWFWDKNDPRSMHARGLADWFTPKPNAEELDKKLCQELLKLGKRPEKGHPLFDKTVKLRSKIKRKETTPKINDAINQNPILQEILSPQSDHRYEQVFTKCLELTKEWIKKNPDGRKPTKAYPRNTLESKLAQYLSHIRNRCPEKPPWFLDEMAKIHPNTINWLNKIQRKTNQERNKEYDEFVKKERRKPSKRSRNKEERNLATFKQNQKRKQKQQKTPLQTT